MQLQLTHILPVAAAFASVAVAQSSSPSGAASSPMAAFGPLVNGLSNSCLGVIYTFVSNPADPLSACLGLSDAFSGLSTVDAKDSLTPLIEGYLDKELCTNTCSNTVLTTANQTLDAGCTSADFAVNGGHNAATLIQGLLDNYWSVKDAGCLTYTKRNYKCLTKTLMWVSAIALDLIDWI